MPASLSLAALRICCRSRSPGALTSSASASKSRPQRFFHQLRPFDSDQFSLAGSGSAQRRAEQFEPFVVLARDGVRERIRARAKCVRRRVGRCVRRRVIRWRFHSALNEPLGHAASVTNPLPAVNLGCVSPHSGNGEEWPAKAREVYISLTSFRSCILRTVAACGSLPK